MANCVGEYVEVTATGHIVFVQAKDDTTPAGEYEYQLEFTPDEAEEFAEELRAAAAEARNNDSRYDADA